MASSRGLTAAAVATWLSAALLLPSCDGAATTAVPRPVASVKLDPLLFEAIERAADEVEADPSDPTRWLRLGKVYQANAHLELAEPCYRRCIELDDVTVDAWYGLALALERLGRQPEAEETMQRALEHAPSYGAGYWRLGTWCLRDGRTDAAEAWFRRATEEEPGLDNGWIGLVRVHLQRDEPERAADVVRTRLLGGVNDAYARQLLATAYRALGREAEARIEAAWGRRQAEPILLDRRWDEILTHKTGRATELERADFSLRHQRHAEAIAILERLDERWPDDVLVLNNLGFAHLRGGDVARAIEVLERACALEQATAREHVNLAQAYSEAARQKPGRRSDALAHLDLAIQLDPDSWSAYSFQGFLHYRWQQRELALESWTRAAEIDPDHVDTLINLATVQRELARPDDAVATFERALAADPTSTRASVLLADLHGERGRLQDAANVLHAALDVLLQIRGAEHPDTRAVEGRLDDVRRRIAE